MILYLEWTKRSSSTGQPDRRQCPATSHHLVPTNVPVCASLCCCRCFGKFAGPGPRRVVVFAGADGPLLVGSKLWFGNNLPLVNLSFHIGDLVWRFGLVRGFVAWSAPPTNATQFSIFARFHVLIPFGAKRSNLDFIFMSVLSDHFSRGDHYSYATARVLCRVRLKFYVPQGISYPECCI